MQPTASAPYEVSGLNCAALELCGVAMTYSCMVPAVGAWHVIPCYVPGHYLSSSVSVGYRLRLMHPQAAGPCMCPSMRARSS